MLSLKISSFLAGVVAFMPNLTLRENRPNPEFYKIWEESTLAVANNRGLQWGSCSLVLIISNCYTAFIAGNASLQNTRTATSLQYHIHAEFRSSI